MGISGWSIKVTISRNELNHLVDSSLDVFGRNNEVICKMEGIRQNRIIMISL